MRILLEIFGIAVVGILAGAGVFHILEESGTSHRFSSSLLTTGIIWLVGLRNQNKRLYK